MIDKIEVLWPILVAIIGFIVYKVIPYVQTKIIKYRYYNAEMSFYLLEYELFGSVVTHLVILFSVIILGKSTWEELSVKEYFIAWIPVTIVYLLVIGIIIKKKKKRGKSKYVRNIVAGFLAHGALSLQLGMIVAEVNDERVDRFVYAWVISMLIVQFLINLEVEKVKNIEHKVYTDNEVYVAQIEPVKRGKYYYVKTAEKGGREWVQIPEDMIIKIEYYVKNIADEKADS